VWVGRDGYTHYSIPASPHPKPVPIHTNLPTYPP